MLTISFSKTRFTWLYFVLIFYLFVFIATFKTIETQAVDHGTQTERTEASSSVTEEAEASTDGSSDSSPEVSIALLDTSVDFKPPPSDLGSKHRAHEHKIHLPKQPKFVNEEEVSEGAKISPFDKQTGNEDLELVHLEKVPAEAFIYQLPTEVERAKLRDIKQLEYKVEPEVSVDEYQIGKDIAKDSELYYTYKEKVANEKKVLSEVAKVVVEAEEYLKSIDSSIRSLVLAVNQVKEAISQNQEQLNNMQKAGSTPNVSIVAQEDEIARLKLKHQELYGRLMSEKRKRQSAIELSLKAKQQELDIKERIKRTEDKISLLEDQLSIHEESSVPTEPLELLKEPEVEVKQSYVPDEYSLAPRRSDVDISPASYDMSPGLEAEESTGAPEESQELESKDESQVKSIKPTEHAPLSISDVTASISNTVLPKEMSEIPPSETTIKTKPQFNEFNLEKFFQTALSGYNSDSGSSNAIKVLSSKINIVNFAMSCLYEVDFYFKQLNQSSGSNFDSSDALKVCRKVWRDSFSQMVRFYGTFAPSTIRAIFKSSIQSDQEAVSSLANYYVEDQFETMARHIDIDSVSSCKNVVTQLFKSADFQESLIDAICKNLVKYYNLYSNLVSDKGQLMLLAAKFAVYASAPYSYDSAPYNNFNDLDQMIMELDFKSLTSSSNFYAQCLKIFGLNYGPQSIYGLSNNSVQSVCTTAQSAFSKALPHGVDVVIFSTKQFPTELIPLLKGSNSVSFYGDSLTGQAEVLLPKDISASNSLQPGTVSDLSPALQLSLHALDQQAKTQKFLQEQQESIKKILQSPLSTGDMHKVVEVLSELNEKQKMVEKSILSVSPISHLQSTIVSIPAGDHISSVKPGSGNPERSYEFTVLEYFIQSLSNQGSVLDSQINQLETVLRNSALSPEDRSVTQSLLKDTEKRKTELSSYFEETLNSVPVNSIAEISGISLSPTVVPGSEKIEFDKSVYELKLLFSEISESNREDLKLIESLDSSSISDVSLKNELDIIKKKVNKIGSKLPKIQKKLQQPNNSFKSKSEMDDFKKLLQKLSYFLKTYAEKLRNIEKVNSQNSQNFNTNLSHSLSPILTQSVLSQVPLPSSTSKISSLLVKIQHIQSQIEKFLAQLKLRKLQKVERRNLKKLFSEIDPKMSSLYKLVVKLGSTHNSSQISDFSQRYLDEVLDVFVKQKKLLREYLVYSNRPDSSSDGIKINSMINDLSAKQNNIEKVLTNGSKRSPVSKEISQSEQPSPSPSPVMEPEFLSKTPPGYKAIKKLDLPAVPLFVRPHTPATKMKYGKTRKDTRGVPIVSGPNAGSKVAERALDYIEKALNRQRTTGIYPEGFRPPGSAAKKPLRPPKVSTEQSFTKSQTKDLFCAKHGYSSMSSKGNNIAYKLYAKSSRILPKSAIANLDRRTACNIASSIQNTKTSKECARSLYPTLLRLGFSVSMSRTEKICAAIGIDGKIEGGCSSLVSYRTSAKYNFTDLEEQRAISLFALFSRLQSIGTIPASSNISQHLVCHVIESMKASLLKGESFSSFLAFECSSAFEQQASHDGAPFTSTQLAAILKACEEAGFPASSG